MRAGTTTSFLATAKDSFGNGMLVGDYGLTARVTVGPDETLTFQRTANANATTRFTFTPVAVGQYIIAIEVRGQPTGVVVPLTVLPASTRAQFDTTRTFVSGSGLSRATVGAPASFVIKAGDSDAVQLATAGGEKFSVRITGRRWFIRIDV